jgi:hypothetical protein
MNFSSYINFNLKLILKAEVLLIKNSIKITLQIMKIQF